MHVHTHTLHTHAYTAHTYATHAHTLRTHPHGARSSAAAARSCCPLGHLCGSARACPLGAGLVACRRLCHWHPKSHPDLQLLNETWAVQHLLPQFIPGTHCCYNWVGCFPSWHSVSKVSCSRKQQQHQVAQLGIEPRAFRLLGGRPNHLAA